MMRFSPALEIKTSEDPTNLFPIGVNMACVNSKPGIKPIKAYGPEKEELLFC